MRWIPTFLIVALLSVGIAACGGASNSLHPTSSASSTPAKTATPTTSTVNDKPPVDFTKADEDRDNDVGAPGDDTNNNSVLDFGEPASSTEKAAITALIKRYYAAALAGDGAGACSMLYFALADAAVEDYASSFGPSYLHGAKSCPEVMALLFKHFHRQLVVELPLLKVVRIRHKERHGLVVMSFGKMPERQIHVHREGHSWKLEELLDGELP